MVDIYNLMANLIEICHKITQPINAQEDPFHRNFNSISRRTIKNVSYERHAYESLEEILGYVPKIDEKKEFGP